MKIKTLKTLYLIGLTIYGGYVFLYPTWIGRSYYMDAHDHAIHGNGVFGLQRVNPEDPIYQKAPLWSPPRASGNQISSEVRWPWQSARQGYYVELTLGAITALLSIGVLVLGILLRIGTWLLTPKQSDHLVTLAWSLSLALTIAWIILLPLELITAMGGGLSDEVIVIAFILACCCALLLAFTLPKNAPVESESAHKNAAT
jgi:hypothetical protein